MTSVDPAAPVAFCVLKLPIFSETVPERAFLALSAAAFASLLFTTLTIFNALEYAKKFEAVNQVL